MKISIALIMVLIFLASCMNIQAIQKSSVEDARGSEPINGATAGCLGIGNLTRDCNNKEGSTRIISIFGKKMRVSANDSGEVVMIMHDTEECGMLGFDCQTKANNRNYSVVKKYFSDNGIKVNSAQAVAGGTVIAGYLLKLDKDGYSLLEKQ